MRDNVSEVLEEAKVAKVDRSKSGERKRPNAIQRFFRETIGELRKVSWPSRQEAINLTKVVLIVVFGMSAFLGVMDFLFSRVFGLILR